MNRLLQFIWLLGGGLGVTTVCGQTALKIDGKSFGGVIHDNVSNAKRQGSGVTPLFPKAFPGANLFRDDAVGINFEHIFNGVKGDNSLAMFTPRKDLCLLKKVGEPQYELSWPVKGSQWEMEARMLYDFSKENRVDLHFECSPKADRYPLGYVAMMWASYMNRAVDRRIHFWGKEGERTGWVAFGEKKGGGVEMGTVSQAGVARLPFEEGAHRLNISEHPEKAFITPFYYGVIDGDHDLKTTEDRLLFMVLFDQTESIRFAMWNFFKDQAGNPDTHSPAWDWQYVIRDPKVGQRYGYRARLVVTPFLKREQVWEEYEQWQRDIGKVLPKGPK